MKFKRMKLITILFFLFFSWNVALAQDLMAPADLEDWESSNFPFMMDIDDYGFKLFSPTTIKEPLFVRHDGDYKELQLVMEAFSQTHYYGGPSPLRFYRRVLDADGKPDFIPVVEIEYESRSRDSLIILTQVGSGYAAKAVDMSLDAQSASSVRFVNFTTVPLLTRIGESSSSVGPQSEIIREFTLTERSYFNFFLGVRNEGEGTKIFSNRYPLREGMRIVFVGYLVANPDPNSLNPPFRLLSHRDFGPERRYPISR